MTRLLLVDTSVWIDVLRGNVPPAYPAIIASGEVVTCLPVIQEVMQGIDAKSRIKFLAASLALADIRVLEDPLTRGVVDDAVALYRSAGAAGFQIRSSVDCLIAACAIRNGAVVVHRDRDFNHLARTSPLQAINVNR